MTDTEGPSQTEPSPLPTAQRVRRSALQTARMIAQAIQVRLRFFIVLIVAFVVVGQWDLLRNYWDHYTRASVGPPNGMQPVSTDTEYFCPMDPGVVSAWPGKCSICNMALVRRKKGDAAPLPNGVVARMQLIPYRIQLAGIQTSPVAYKPLERVVDTVGRVVTEESRVHAIRAPRNAVVTEVRVGASGEPVKQGEGLFVLGAQSDDRDAPSVDEPVRSPVMGRLAAVKAHVGDEVKSGSILAEVVDLTKVGVDAELFEKDLLLVSPGLRAEVTSEFRTGRAPLAGSVLSVRRVETNQGSFLARIEVDNESGALWPGNHVFVRILTPISRLEPFRSLPSDPAPLRSGDLRALYVCPDHPDVIRESTGRCPKDQLELERQPLGDLQRVGWWCPMHPNVMADHPGEKCQECGGMVLLPRVVSYSPAGQVLAVPESAVVDTGSRTIVFVDRGLGMFEGLEVVLGPRCGEEYPVVRGLEAGQRVATSGGFLLDAETRLNPSLAAGYFGAARASTETKSSAPAIPQVEKGSSAGLPPADRALVAQQKVCPVTGEPLGSMGTPVRVSVAGRVVFLCCSGCKAALAKNPEKYLSRLKQP